MRYVDLLMRYLASLDVTFKILGKYRTELVVNLIRTVLSPLAIIVVWTLVYAASGTTSINGFSGSLFFSYFLVAAALGPIAVSTNVAWMIQGDIRSGSVSPYLARPTSYPWVIFFDNFAEMLSDTAVTLLPIMVLVVVLLHPALTPLTLLEFIVELLLISFMTAAIFFMLGCASVYFVNVGGMINLLLWMFNVLGGRLIPLNIMPTAIAGALQSTPIYLVYYLPSATFTGLATQSYILQGILNLLLWIGIFTLLAALVWKRSKSNLLPSGG